MKQKFFVRAILAAACCFTIEQSSSSQVYHVTRMPGSTRTFSMNNLGVVVGRYVYPFSGITEPFRWTPDVPNGKSGTLVTINSAGSASAEATAINDAGVIVGNWQYYNSFKTTGFRIAPGATSIELATDLITHPTCAMELVGINNSGTIIGNLKNGDFWDDLVCGFRIGSGTHVVSDSARLTGAGIISKALSLNSYDQVTGMSSGFGKNLGVIALSATGFMSAASIPDPLYTYEATGMSTSGVLIGQYTDGTNYRGFIVPVGQSLTFPNNDFGSTKPDSYVEPLSINSNNIAVGVESYYDGQGHIEAIIRNYSGVFNLNSMVDESGAGIHLQYAYQINEAGQILARTNTLDDVLLTPTQPYQVVSASPHAFALGSGDTQMKVTGFGFVPLSRVQWNGHTLPTTYVSDEELSATIPANYLKSSGAALITVKNPSGKITNSQRVVIGSLIKSFTVTPFTVGGGADASGMVTLSDPAPVGGMTVAITSSSGAAIPPASVMIPEGNLTIQFAINTMPVVADTKLILTAKLGAEVHTANLTIKRSTAASLMFDKSSVKPGGSATGTVTLTGKAPMGGVEVMLTSNKPALTVPASVVVPAGMTTATFSVMGNAVSAKTPVTVTAKTGTVSKTGLISVMP